MEEKFKPFYQMIPVLSDVVSTSLHYDPTAGFQEEDEFDDDVDPLDDEP